MLSTTLCMTRWSEVRRMRRALALPFFGAVVGLFLTTASASSRTSRARDVAASVESSVPIVASSVPLLHSPAAVLDAQRRVVPTASDLHPAHAGAIVHEHRATIALAAGRHVPRTTFVTRGYDATAPPFRFV